MLPPVVFDVTALTIFAALGLVPSLGTGWGFGRFAWNKPFPPRKSRAVARSFAVVGVIGTCLHILLRLIKTPGGTSYSEIIGSLDIASAGMFLFLIASAYLVLRITRQDGIPPEDLKRTKVVMYTRMGIGLWGFLIVMIVLIDRVHKHP